MIGIISRPSVVAAGGEARWSIWRSWPGHRRIAIGACRVDPANPVAPTRAAATAAIDVFADKYGARYNKAVACLTKDREALLAFFDFPAEHWDHLRTSNPIESVFATVRHRTVRTKGALSTKTAKLMVFKLVTAAAKTWRRLKGENQLPKVVKGVKFQNGIEVIEMPAHHAA